MIEYQSGILYSKTDQCEIPEDDLIHIKYDEFVKDELKKMFPNTKEKNLNINLVYFVHRQIKFYENLEKRLKEAELDKLVLRKRIYIKNLKLTKDLIINDDFTLCDKFIKDKIRKKIDEKSSEFCIKEFEESKVDLLHAVDTWLLKTLEGDNKRHIIEKTTENDLSWMEEFIND